MSRNESINTLLARIARRAEMRLFTDEGVEVVGAAVPG
jgi:hypothetical protein